MDGPHRRDINELLVNGYFKTSRARSPSSATPTSANTPSFLRPAEHVTPRDRSSSRAAPRGPRKPPPPRPTVEDEVVSLAREHRSSPVPSYDPPLRGIVDQNPIMLEADVSAVEAARLHAAPCPKEADDNTERRFVLLPRSDSNASNRENKPLSRENSRDHAFDSRENPPSRKNSRGHTPISREQLPPRKNSRDHASGSRENPPRKNSRDHTPSSREKPPSRKNSRDHTPSSKDTGKLRPEFLNERDTANRPPLERRRSRQDLPSLQTKVPRDLPPQFRRSTSAYASTPKDHDETPRPAGPRTPATDSFLSPDVQRGHPKDYFSGVPTPRHSLQEGFGARSGTPSSEKRSSGGSASSTRPGTPLSEKRHSGNFETAARSRRGTNEKLTRPQQHSDEFGRRSDRHSSGPDRTRSSRLSAHLDHRYYSSSEDDLADSEEEMTYSRRHHHSLLAEDEQRRSSSRSNTSTLERPFTGSRFASPVPSPKVSPSQIPRGDAFERKESFPQSRDNREPNSRPVSPLSAAQETPRASERLNPLEAAAIPRPRSHQSIAMPIPTMKPAQPTAPPGSLPMPIPSRNDLQPTADTRRAPSVPRFDENGPSSARPGVSSWQPPPFQPPTSNLDKPVGSFRRYSEDMERGAIAPLPSCPRTTFTRGRNDWLTLPRCPSFDICPSCFNSTIAPTEFRNYFIPAPRRSPTIEVLCDFGSSPWYRIAWLLTRKERRRDLKLFYGLANLAATAPPCLGKHEAVRQWHSILDPKTGAPIRNFDVCYSCVKSIETLLPAIRGIFVRTDNHGPPGVGRVCDLRFDSKRFIQYFDALETTADKAEDDDDDLPDTRRLAHLVRRLASFNECERDVELMDRRWHVITQLPELTVCEECFDEVVWPELEEGKAIPAMFNKTLQRIPKASCQMYSERMRAVFRKAVDSDDYKFLASKARERKTVEMAYKANLEAVKRQSKVNPPLAAMETQRITEEWRKWE